jgi:hypothetical protein
MRYLAPLVYVLIADATFETYASGSPVRWWIVATVLALPAARGGG